MLATFFSFVVTVVISVIGGLIGGYLVLKYHDHFEDLEEKLSDFKARVKTSRKKRSSHSDTEEFWPDPDDYPDDFDEVPDDPDDLVD